MMEKVMMKNDGGPAFPKISMSEHLQDEEVVDGLAAKRSLHAGANGMSLRDWFAGMVLPANAAACEAWNITQKPEDQFPGPQIAEVAATRSYMYADAMLAAREKRDAE